MVASPLLVFTFTERLTHGEGITVAPEAEAHPARRIEDVHIADASEGKTPSNGGIQDFLASMMLEYKQSKLPQISAPEKQVTGPTDTVDQHLNNPDYKQHYGPNGQLESVTGPDGKTVMTFSDYQNGKPMNIGMPDGSHFVSKDGGKTYFRVAADGEVFPFEFRNLSVDKRGNITFDHPTGEDARVTIAVDGAVIKSPHSRDDWPERSKDATVQRSADGRTMTVVDRDGNPIRTVNFDAKGNPQEIINGDGSRWSTTDGGKTWYHTRANGSQYFYRDANMRVDKNGNISYDNPYGERMTETIDGRIIRVKKS